jgi:hypothetical protein
MKTKRIAKILGLGLAAALAFSLGAGIGLTPASADVHEWSTITTPSWEDYVILPDSDIQDYAIEGDDGLRDILEPYYAGTIMTIVVPLPGSD